MSDATTVLAVVSVVVLGLLTGNELAVGAFVHPTVGRLPKELHVAARSVFARLFGKVMPPWFAVSLILNLLLFFGLRHSGSSSTHLSLAALLLQAFAVVFSIAPVRINNRIARWNVSSLPENWSRDERMWDRLHAFRTTVLGAAFVCLTIAVTRN